MSGLSDNGFIVSLAVFLNDRTYLVSLAVIVNDAKLSSKISVWCQLESCSSPCSKMF